MGSRGERIRIFSDPQPHGELEASLGFRRLCQDKKKEGKENENRMKGSGEQWVFAHCCSVVGRGRRWEEATCSHSRTAPTGSSTLITSNPDGLCFSFQCLVTCGKGHKHRQVWCQFGEDRLSDRMCDPEAKPEPMQTCQQPECAAWQAGPWGQVF